MLLFLLACGVTEDNFPDRYAAETCARFEECFQAEYELAYDDMGECTDEVVDILSFADSCDFDAAAAADCLDEVRSADCADLFDSSASSGCNQVYTNCAED